MPKQKKSLFSENDSFGRYRIIKLLGEGGMGEVYLAEDSQLARQVALKVPHFSGDDGPDVIERFHREARVAAGIHHPNVCGVHDVGEIGGIHYLTMPYIPGTPLSSRMRMGEPWPVPAALYDRPPGGGLEVFHKQGKMHRDLKPANIMLLPDGDEPVIMDFGLARSVTGSDRMTMSGW